jgi:DNA polymerase III subunit delta'
LAGSSDSAGTAPVNLREKAISGLNLQYQADLTDAHGPTIPKIATIKQAGKESVDQRRRANLLIGELARFFRGVLWQTAGLEPPCPDAADRTAAIALAQRLEPEDVFVLADRCMVADYHVHRRLYMPLIVESLTHDLGKQIDTRSAS